MNKIYLLILSIVFISLLSGCIDTQKSTSNNYSPIVEQTNATHPVNLTSEVIKNLTSESASVGEGKIVKISDSSQDTPHVNTAVTATNPGWCEPGSSISVKLESGERAYTIIGTATYEGRDVCQAELVDGLVKSTKYFTQDGKFESMTSSASGNGSVSVEASTHINTSE